MPLHFAAARSTARSPIARALAKKAYQRAANDNGDAAPAKSSFDATMRGALKHFAEHGLGSARVARREAEKAHRSGDTETYDWWLGICRSLDPRMAEMIARNTGSDAALIS